VTALLTEERVSKSLSAVFLLFVGLSMPSLFAEDGLAGDGLNGHRRLAEGLAGAAPSRGSLAAGELLGHVGMVTVLMVLGKCFPVFCYRSEVNLRTRVALSLGMCPRGEVGAGVITISLGFGIEGPAIVVAVVALALNLLMSPLFCIAVKALAEEPAPELRRRSSARLDPVPPAVTTAVPVAPRVMPSL
jgi:hypothetical protein